MREEEENAKQRRIHSKKSMSKTKDDSTVEEMQRSARTRAEGEGKKGRDDKEERSLEKTQGEQNWIFNILRPDPHSDRGYGFYL